MIGYGFTVNVDYTPYQKVHPQNKQIIEDYIEVIIGFRRTKL